MRLYTLFKLLQLFTGAGFPELFRVGREGGRGGGGERGGGGWQCTVCAAALEPSQIPQPHSNASS